MWLCLCVRKSFEGAHEDAYWTKGSKMQSMWICIFPCLSSAEAHEQTQWGKASMTHSKHEKMNNKYNFVYKINLDILERTEIKKCDVNMYVYDYTFFQTFFFESYKREQNHNL